MTEITNLDMEEINITTDVLVIGGGFTGIKAASEITGLGYKVILIEADAELGSQKGPNFLVDLNREDLKGLQDLESKIKADANIQVLTQTRLIRLAGVTGDFTVELAKGEESIEYKVGAIVVASDFSVEALNEKYGLFLTENVLAQSQLETLLASDNGTGKAKLTDKTVAFLVGFGQEGNPLVMERVMRSVLAIEAIDGCTPYVYVG
ncbi:MAG: FAD-dependent oxidoreductase, partial [Deltaproteobacteria bacterium]|nr:FAD-dependent oxidoreductase [Deltaproteobacteria bacterium]